MSAPRPSSLTRFRVHTIAVVAARIAIAQASLVPAPLRSIGDQLIRSAAAVPSNLAEGAGRRGRDRLARWRTAYGEALETGSHLALLAGHPALDQAELEQAAQLFDQVRAMTWRLLHPKRQAVTGDRHRRPSTDHRPPSADLRHRRPSAMAAVQRR